MFIRLRQGRLSAPAAATLIGIAVLAMAVLSQRSPSQAGAIVDCGTQQRSLAPWSNANVTFKPTSGAPGDPFTSSLSGAPSSWADGEIEAIMDFDPQSPGSGMLVGEGTLPAGQTGIDVPSTVPNATPGGHTLFMCEGPRPTWRYGGVRTSPHSPVRLPK